jgi:hypothetical protein
MTVPPITIMPLAPMTAARIGIAGPIIVMPFCFRRVYRRAARLQLRSRRRIVGHHAPLSIYRPDGSILSSNGTPLTHCCQSAQLDLMRRWINRDRFPTVNASDSLRVNRSDSRIQ